MVRRKEDEKPGEVDEELAAALAEVEKKIVAAKAALPKDEPRNDPAKRAAEVSLARLPIEEKDELRKAKLDEGEKIVDVVRNGKLYRVRVNKAGRLPMICVVQNDGNTPGELFGEGAAIAISLIDRGAARPLNPAHIEYGGPR